MENGELGVTPDDTLAKEGVEYIEEEPYADVAELYELNQ